jgi:hypothetical protein
MNADEAIIAKLVWKSNETRAYARELLETGVRLYIAGKPYFNNDDVRESAQPGDKTTVGAVIRTLLMQKIIERAFVHLPDQGIHYGTRKSSRPECNGHANPVYKLTNTGIAMEWLKRNGGPVAPRQMNLFGVASTTTTAVMAGL